MPSAGSLAGMSALQAGGNAQGLFAQSQGIQSALTPFFQNEMYNPQGFGPTTLSQIMTQEGQGTAGALGAARQSAMNLGARTGNLAAIPELSAAANKAGITQMSNLAGQLGIANANERLSQQQSGASGLSGIMGQDLSASTDEAAVQQEAIKNLQAAQNAGFMHQLTSTMAGDLGQSLGEGATAGVGEALPFANPF